jgi:hypothetical protein
VSKPPLVLMSKRARVGTMRRAPRTPSEGSTGQQRDGQGRVRDPSPGESKRGQELSGVLAKALRGEDVPKSALDSARSLFAFRAASPRVQDALSVRLARPRHQARRARAREGEARAAGRGGRDCNIPPSPRQGKRAQKRIGDL